MKLLIFNPENDMALASGSPGYTPPANIRVYRRQHWDLPKQWASPDDIVWDGTSTLSHLFLDRDNFPEICPWGWSPALVHELELAGVPRQYMPSNEYLAQLRLLSSRTTTVTLQQSLGIEAAVCHNISEIEHYIQLWQSVVMKSPWSSSGKGLMHTDNPNWKGWVQRILRLQGSVVVERMVDKQQDFAMEFWLSDTEAKFMGINIFTTDAHGHFLSNTPTTLSEASDSISSLLRQPETLSQVQQYFSRQLPILAPWYRGPVGVDMLVTAQGNLHPCIEINWRMTMGMVERLRSK